MIDGQTLEATHVAIDNGYAYVSYGVRGETALGAVDVFDIRTPSSPVLASQVVLRDADVAALAVHRNKLYLATGSSDPTFPEPAVLEELTLQNNLPTNQSRRVSLPSYLATGVYATDTKVYVTSGSGGASSGGLTILDAATLNRLGGDTFLDARAVGGSGNYIVVAQGTPGRTRIYDKNSSALLGTVATGGASIANSKSSVSVHGVWAFVASGDGGMSLVQVTKQAVVGSLPRPTANGVDPADAVTNAVTASGAYLLSANGGAGVHVTYSNYETTAQSGTPSLVPLGRLAFPGPVSANFVASSNTVLFAATGLGGLKIVGVQ